MIMDLKHPKALGVMERLCKWADVICNNFRPGVMESLGLVSCLLRGSYFLPGIFSR